MPVAGCGDVDPDSRLQGMQAPALAEARVEPKAWISDNFGDHLGDLWGAGRSQGGAKSMDFRSFWEPFCRSFWNYFRDLFGDFWRAGLRANTGAGTAFVRLCPGGGDPPP